LDILLDYGIKVSYKVTVRFKDWRILKEESKEFSLDKSIKDYWMNNNSFSYGEIMIMDKLVLLTKKETR
jgi:hypothetical protein